MKYPIEASDFLYSNGASKDYVNSLIDIIEASVYSLEFNPNRCPSCADYVLGKKKFRKLIIDKYIAFFFIDEKNKIVYLNRFIASKRAWKKMI